MRFDKSHALQQRLQSLVPAGSHTYAKGADQFPQQSPGVLVRGSGCHVWDPDGNEFIEYGMGLRAVTLGHAFPAVVNAVRDSLDLGTNFTRPSTMELECAEAFLDIIAGADMVKFTKDGSTATSAALKLARAYTGRKYVAICAEHPFFSYDDWFICTTTLDGGIPMETRAETLQFSYNDADSLRRVFEDNPGKIAAVFLEAARTEDPKDGFLQQVKSLCQEHGAVLVFDEMITGFRWNVGGAQKEYGVTPDLSTFGKALANGFSLSALCGKRELMRLGSREREQDNVFLLSTTHGAETPGLAAAMATMATYRSEPVIEHLHRQGERLASGFRQVADHHKLSDYVGTVGRPCNLLYYTKGPDGQPSQEYRTLFLQETTSRGVLMPSLVVSYSHTDADVDRTIDAIDGALGVYSRALDAGSVDGLLVGGPSRHVFERH